MDVGNSASARVDFRRMADLREGLDPLWGLLLTSWNRSMEAARRAPKTRRLYLDAATALINYLADSADPPAEAAEITKAQIEEFLIWFGTVPTPRRPEGRGDAYAKTPLAGRSAGAPASSAYGWGNEAMAATRVEACIVNHNSSEFTELALRTLVGTHAGRIEGGELRITVLDNHSTDDGLADLRAAVRDLAVGWELSPWPAAESAVNSHGDVLRAFTLAHEDASHLWFLDCDVTFTQPDCLGIMLADLAAEPDLWAVQARFRWLEQHQGRGASLNIWAGRRHELWASVGPPPARSFPGVHKRRCHPACILIANTPVFRRVAAIVGLSAGMTLSVDEQFAGFADTLGPASLTLETHGLRYALSDAVVGHYHGVTYHDPANPLDAKRAECRQHLTELRAGIDLSASPQSR